MYCNDDVVIPEFIDRSIDIEVGFNGKKLDYFTQLLCDDAFRIPLQTNWVMLIVPDSTNLNAQILNIANNYDPLSHSITQNLDVVNQTKYQNVIGCVFAQDVKIPGEDVAWERTQGYGGYLPAPVTTVRSISNILEVGFLETNKSFSDFFIRHWISLVGYKGLVARKKENSIKSTIYVFQFETTRKPDATLNIRKRFVFNDAVPVLLDSESLGYDAYTNNDNKRQCSFVYSKHAIFEN